MEKDYDLFERSQNHSLVWRGSVHGLENARRKLQQLARTTTNECSVIYLPTRQVVALANIAHAKRVVFQVAYDEQKLMERADLLKLRGYEVVSVLGNERARTVLGLPQRVDLFIVGHNAPEPTRREMVVWLKAKFPSVRVVALNSAEYRELAGADYNAVLNGPETWLPIVEAAVREASAFVTILLTCGRERAIVCGGRAASRELLRGTAAPRRGDTGRVEVSPLRPEPSRDGQRSILLCW